MLPDVDAGTDMDKLQFSVFLPSPLGPSIVKHVVVDIKLAPKQILSTMLNQPTYCDTCEQNLDGPCYEHTDASNILFDKLLPLAYFSLPDALHISTSGENVGITAKEMIKAGTLFGPLIAPLVPLDSEDPNAGLLRYVLWSEDTQDFQAYDLTNDFQCNWIKFVRTSVDLDEVNVVAYQLQDSIYFVTVKDIQPDTEMRVYIKAPNSGKGSPNDAKVFPSGAEYLSTAGRAQSQTGAKKDDHCSGSVMSYEEDHEDSQSSEPVNQKAGGRKPRISKNRNAYETARKNRIREKRYREGAMTDKEKAIYEKYLKRLEAAGEVAPVYEPSRGRQVREGETLEERRQAAARFNAEKQLAQARLLKQRYENNELTSEEKVEYERRKKAKRERMNEYNKKKTEARLAAMTEQQRVAKAAREKQLKFSLEAMRLKLLQGESLTPEEQLMREKRWAAQREASLKKHAKNRIKRGQDPKDYKPRWKRRAPLFDWQLAEKQSEGGSSQSADDGSHDLGRTSGKQVL